MYILYPGQYCENARYMHGSIATRSLRCSCAKHRPDKHGNPLSLLNIDFVGGMSTTWILLEARPFFDYCPLIAVGGMHAEGHYFVGYFLCFPSPYRVCAKYIQVCRVSESLLSQQQILHEYPSWRLTRPRLMITV